MSRKVLITIALITLLSLIIGVFMFRKRAPVTCEQIEQITLDMSELENLEPDQLIAWLEETYQLNEREITAGELSDGTFAVDWQKGETRYAAYFRKNTLSTIGIYQLQIQPTVKEIIDCFGPPEAYYAEHFLAQEYGVSLELWYPEQGLIISAVHFTGNDKQFHVDENIIMNGIALHSPGILEQVYKNLGPNKYPIDALMPWPDDWADVVLVDTRP